MAAQPLPVIAGPTAGGKTALAIWLARQLNGEVISADSMQVYKELRVGTARPTSEETGEIPYRLAGHVGLEEDYHVARYAAEAHAAIRDAAARGKLPILCGGTGLYIRSVIENLTYTDQPSSPSLREELRRRYDDEGGDALLARLAAVDPETAARLHPHDAGRIIRALEVYETTGVTMAEQQRLSHAAPSPYDVCLLVLSCRNRQTLYDRIDRRVDEMLAGGLLDEARSLLNDPRATTARQAIGYKELAPYFSGEIPLEEAVDALKRDTRRYAKRQLSWFRAMANAEWLYSDDYDDPDGLRREALRRIREHYRKEEHR
ncbi:MAG: tRNA (adenosine(37)-N6)-dimethylallyltransferase MiaA [Acutalibacteraceae bacterium]|jgi:tRNA dimethylallyltransferase